MHHKLLFHLILWPFIYVNSCFGSSQSFEITVLKKYFSKKSASLIKKIKKGEIYANSEVIGDKKLNKQNLNFEIIGLHPKNCRKAMRKLSLYEQYSDFIDYVSVSKYNQKTEKISLLLESKILPIKMSLAFKLGRITGKGKTLFVFPNGFLKGLKGQMSLYEYNKQCLFHTTAFWQGEHTAYSDTVIEFFSEELSRRAMSTLFRISKF